MQSLDDAAGYAFRHNNIWQWCSSKYNIEYLVKGACNMVSAGCCPLSEACKQCQQPQMFGALQSTHPDFTAVGKTDLCPDWMASLISQRVSLSTAGPVPKEIRGISSSSPTVTVGMSTKLYTSEISLLRSLSVSPSSSHNSANVLSRHE